ncbi:hypothetical protein OOT46_10780 [Aquabacterium sp. A7-Y]|uniref:hypothetical protein n=1 Tax=Aquabacterium sp. A7-Y TaxID=1349605 RepID=UPI00223D313E|nr:hypothetical protein [Aquabacterium sp. A7-Y]MCW7538324.1 hypothetical protein [Aquabacterium sp. A7-Y]
MTPTTITLQLARRNVAPRGADALAALCAGLARLVTLPVRALAQRPHATRVAHDLNSLADRYQASQPLEAAELRAAAQAYLAR